MTSQGTSSGAGSDALTARVGNRTPNEVKAAMRSVVRLVGRGTAAVRMEPDFLIVGAQRCGTTTVHKLLSRHPAVVRPLLHKGIGYFDTAYGEHSAAWYRGHFPVAAAARLRTRRYGRPLTFESGGYIMFHPLAPGRIGKDLPDARLIAIVRDPVERAYSAHRHELARGFETEEFERALELEPERLAGEAERIRNKPGYESFSHRHHAYIGRGRYAEQIVSLREAVGPDQVFVLDADLFFADPITKFHELTDWLGLPRWTPGEVGKLNARPRDPMAADLRQRLMAEFDASDEALVPLLGAVPSWRR